MFLGADPFHRMTKSADFRGARRVELAWVDDGKICEGGVRSVSGFGGWYWECFCECTVRLAGAVAGFARNAEIRDVSVPSLGGPIQGGLGAGGMASAANQIPRFRPVRGVGRP